MAKGAALYGYQEELRSKIEDLEQEEQADGQSVDRGAIEKRVAEESGLALGALQRMTETKVTNVCSRGFGIKVVREGFTGENDSEEEFYVDHLIRENDPLPVDPPRVETYGTVFDNQSSVRIVLMEQAGSNLSIDMEHNKQLEKRDFHLPGSDPKGTPIQVSIGMGNDGLLTVTAKHPAVEELTFSAASKDGVITKEQVAESAAKVQAMQRT